MGNWEELLERALDGLPAQRALRSMDGVWLVGGAIRDAVWGAKPKDWDFIVLEEQKEAFRNLWIAHRITEFRVNDRFQTTRIVLHGDKYVDFNVIPSAEALEGDLRRRDFTVNALAIRLRGGQLVDLVGGRKDLENRFLRPVKPENLRKDPVRVLRGFRMLAEYGLEESPTFLPAVREAVPQLPQVAGERIFQEVQRMALLPGIGRLWARMLEIGVWDALIPEFGEFESCPSSPYSLWSLLEHTRAALEALEETLENLEAAFPGYGADLESFLTPERRAFLRLALLLHDVGKVRTLTWEDERPQFHGHEQVGAEIAENALRRLRFPNRWIEVVTTLIRGHLRIGFYAREEVRPVLVYRFFREFGDLGVLLIVHSRADVLGYAPSEEREASLREHRRVWEALLEAYFRKHALMVRPPRLVTGRDLLALGLRPGPEIGRLLERIQEMAAIGELRTREDALRWVRDQIARVAR